VTWCHDALRLFRRAVYRELCRRFYSSGVGKDRRAMLSLGIKGKTLLPILLIGGIIVAGAVGKVTQASSEAIHRAALEKASNLASQMSALQGYYTQYVVAPAREKGVRVSHDDTGKPGTIPLPATMVHEMNATLSQKEGYSIRLY